MDRLFIFDTTLRDGEQVPGCQLNTVEKIQVAKSMEGVDSALLVFNVLNMLNTKYLILNQESEALKKN